MKRTELREHIFKMVFELEFVKKEELNEQIQLYFENFENTKEIDYEYIQKKANDIAVKLDEIDTLINERTTGWKTSRMNKVDLTILRLAVFEMKWDEDVPTGVAIDEAVELAKKYSSEEGPSFVNGVLAKLAQ